MGFVYTATVRFAEVDPAQVMYFSRVYELAHEAFEELMTAVGYPPSAVFTHNKWGMPLVHTEADYRRPWRLGESISIQASLAEVGEKSIAFEYSFVGDDGEPRTRVGMRHVFVSLETFEACAPPDDVIDKLRALLN